jgi:hypothetical protein
MDASRSRVRAEPTVRFRQPGLVDRSLFDRVRAAPERVNDLCPFPSREFEGLVCQEHAIHAPKCSRRHTQRQRLSPVRIQALKRRRGLGSWRKSGLASLLFTARLARPPTSALGKSCLPVESVARLRLGLAPWPVAGVSVDSSSPGWLPQKTSLWPLTHRHPPGPFPLIGRQSARVT